MDKKKVAGLTAAAVGVAALLFGLLSHEWVIWRAGGTEIHVGLRSIESCQEVSPGTPGAEKRSCTTTSHREVAGFAQAVDGYDSFRLVARITFFTGLVTAGLMVLVLALALANRFPDLPIAPSSLAIVASAAGVIGIATTLAVHPWKSLGWGTGSAVLLSGGGAAACLLGAILLGRLRPAVDDMWRP
jgi:hypothetical protein